MSFRFPRELYPCVLPSHEETDPSWDAFCCWGTFSGLNVCGVDSLSRPKIVAQQTHGLAAKSERFVSEGPSVPFSSPGACAWLSQWTLREPVLAPVRTARRTARRRFEVIREWIGKAKCSDAVRDDLETYYREMYAHDSGDEPVMGGSASHELAGAPSVENQVLTVPGGSRARYQLSNLAAGSEGLFGEVTVPKANYAVGGCIKCVPAGRKNGSLSDGSTMLLASVDGSNHDNIKFSSFDLGQCQSEYPYLGRVCSTTLQLPTTIRQVDLCMYDEDPYSLLCAVRLDGGSISVHDVQVATGNEDPTLLKLADCFPGGASCVALNPYWRGEWLTANNSQIAIWSVQPGNSTCADPLVCREIQPVDSAGFAAGRKLQVHYGCHPRSAIVVEPMLVNMLDFRTPATAVELFSLPSSLLHKHEYLVRTVQLRGQPFYHCALADHSLLLFDERFPGHCLLHCSIPCSSPATYLDMVDVDISSSMTGGAFLAVGCQESLEAYCFYLSTNDPAPHLCTRPWRAGPLTEFLHLDATRPKPTEAAIVNQRIESAVLMGLSVAAAESYSAKADGQRVVLFQLTSYGDVFMQTCFKQHSAVDENADSGEPRLENSRSPPRPADADRSRASLSRAAADACKCWIHSLLDQAEWVASASRSETTCRKPQSGRRRRLPAADPTLRSALEKADAHELLASVTSAYGMKAHISCSVCGVPCVHADASLSGMDRIGRLDYTGMVVTDDICYSCSLRITDASALRTAIEDDVVVPTDISLNHFMASTAHFNADNFVDPNSKLHLKLWHGEDIEESLVARDEEWRVYRETRQPKAATAQQLGDSSLSDDDCEDNAGSVFGSNYTPSIGSTATRKSQQRRESISSSAGFIATPKRLHRHKEPPETKMQGDKLDEELDAVPLAFLSMSAQPGSPRQLFRTPASQDRPRKPRLVQGF